jgi:hypothetical protein
MVSRNAVKTQQMGFITHQANEFRKIYVGRTTDTALGAGKAAPDSIV